MPDARFSSVSSMRTSRAQGKQRGLFGRWWRVRIFLRKLLADRDIYARSQGRLHTLSLSSGGQFFLILLALGAFGWLIYASASLTYYRLEANMRTDQVLALEAKYESGIAAMQARHDALAVKLNLAQTRFVAVTEEMEAQHDYLLSVLGKNSRLGQLLEERRQEYQENLPDEINRRKKKALPVVGDDGQSNILYPRALNGAGLDFAVLTALPPDLTAGAFRQEKEEASGFSSVAAKAHLPGVLAETGDAALDSVLTRLEQIDAEQQMIAHHIGQLLEGRLQHYQQAMKMIGVFDITRLIERIERADRALAQEGNTEEGAETAENGQGGPFVPLDSAGLSLEAPAAEEMTRTNATLIHLEQIDRLLFHLPLVLPMKPPYYITSGYGPRVDPFTQRWAFHAGMDLAAPKRKPKKGQPAGAANDAVYATLPGVATEAGGSINYGNMVAIDHGYGIATRYGHMSRISVKAGDKIKQGQQIGVIGNSGRSTGKHLHYEILIDGEQYDPWTFIEAGKHVFNIKDP